MARVVDLTKPTAKRKEYALQFNSEWRKAVESIIKSGKILIQAKADLPHGQFLAMIEGDLTCTPRTAQRIKAIAEDPNLSNATYVSHLPPCWSTLYALRKIPKNDFEDWIESGEIHPGMELKDVEKLRSSARIQRVPRALKDLSQVAQRYPDIHDLADHIENNADWSSLVDEFTLPEMKELPTWIEKLILYLEERDGEHEREREAAE